MKLVETLIATTGGPVLDAHLAFQVSAGVDTVVALAPDPQAREQLETHEAVHVVPDPGGDDQTKRTHLARVAAVEHGADWVVNAEPAELWWPRGESLKDVLEPIPPRYTVVQALRRTFFAEGQAGDIGERMTSRRSLSGGTTDERPSSFLLPVHRGRDDVAVGADRSVVLKRFVPLRAWYPLEVLDVAERERPSGVEVVEDLRVRDALRALHAGGKPDFRTPDIVSDAAYAVECAAVGEVDLPALEQYITELEQRIGWLEQRVWPRVLRAGSRLVRRANR